MEEIRIANFPTKLSAQELLAQLVPVVEEDTVKYKKEGYIHLMPLLNKYYESFSGNEEDLKIFLELLEKLIGVMDYQIYEHYRSVVEMKKKLSNELNNVAEKKEDLKLILKTARSATFLISEEGPYYTSGFYRVYVNGADYSTVDTAVFTVYDLLPDTTYVVSAVHGDRKVETTIHTNYELVTLNVKAFGAKGDGLTDDTHYIQAAIMACPKDGRVLIPEGNYMVSNIFLKSDVNIELAKGANIMAYTSPDKMAILPGMIEGTDEVSEYNLGTWEGNPISCYAGIICGINASNVTLYGQGTIDGCGSKENWWKDPRNMKIYRPRLLFINHCDGFRMQGLTLKNSPSWTIHPYFSDHITFAGTTILNPSDSPNTDGLDPESCNFVEIVGVHFSLGDDCIAIKSGKLYMGKKYKKPSENLHIYQCLMQDGHGAVTLGSECAGGVKNLLVEDCLFTDTDRGLRVKTRRGRGNDAVLDNITFRNLTMRGVMNAFTANAFYFCDPDGKADYVQTRKLLPVDEGTPFMRKFTFENINASDCHVSALFFAGLPEAPIEEIVMKHIRVSFKDDAKSGTPIMSCGVPECSKRGIHIENVKRLVLKDIEITGYEGELYELSGCNEIVKD